MPSEVSIRAYSNTVQLITKRASSKNLEDILNYVKNDTESKISTKINYLNSYISLAREGLLEGYTGNLKPLEEYRDKLQMDLEKIKQKDNLTSKQKEIMSKVSYTDLLNGVQMLGRLKTNSLQDLTNYLMLALPVKYPLRNDLIDIELTSDLKVAKNGTKNYLYLPKVTNRSKKGAILFLREYKTAQSYGDQEIEISLDLTKDIANLVALDPNRKYLFQTTTGTPLSSSDFTHRLQRLTDHVLGTPVSTTLIRKIFLTDKYGETVQEMKEDAKMMLHSGGVQQSTYIANNRDKP